RAAAPLPPLACRIYRPCPNHPAVAPSERTVPMPTPLLRHLASPLLVLLLDTAPLAAQEANRNVRFGLPAPANADPESKEAYLIERPQYVLSFNAKKLTPNWVCWQLRKEDIGSEARGPFGPDHKLPERLRVVSGDYNGTGFDRGHMCPA